MSAFDINVFDDNVDDMDIIRNITNTKNCEDAFYIADIGSVIERHRKWINKMPRVIPHYGTFVVTLFIHLYSLYRVGIILATTMVHVLFKFPAIKCNPNATVIKVLAALNASFDCASKVSSSIRTICSINSD